jgi:crotonobetainyl-CoA:carnitine CoA-transferase CaiB-like acyl-CoA transferase
MPKVLEGIRVADFSHVMAGPFASHFLSLLGADVIKLEAPERGDPMRYYGDDRRYDGMAPAFIAANAGKRSIVVDLKQDSGREVARRLIASSDVVLENFRPGVMERLGLGYEACKALRPQIVFCSISGFGQSGPLRDYPAIDNTVQAASGMMSMSGEPGGAAARVGFPVVDSYTGTLAALAVTSALLGRERFGGGQHIDVSMLDASLVLMSAAAVPYLVTGQTPARTGNVGFSGQPTAGVFQTKDGTQVSLGVVQANQYAALSRAIGREDLLTDARFASPELRKRNAPALRELLEQVFQQRDGAVWERLLAEAGAPCGLVRDVASVLSQPQLDTRTIKQPIRMPGLPDRQDVHVLNAGFEFASDGPGVTRAPPALGEHTEELLEELGFSAEQRARMRASGAAYARRAASEHSGT